jgi:hypothetical protein
MKIYGLSLGTAILTSIANNVRLPAPLLGCSSNFWG